MRKLFRLDALGFVPIEHGFCDISCEFNDLHHLAAGIANRIIGGSNPDFVAVFRDSFEVVRNVFAALKFRPEFAVITRFHELLITEDAMMPARNFFQLVTHRFQKIVVRRNDCSVRVELDNQVGSANRFHLSSEVSLLNFNRFPFGDPVPGDHGTEIGSCRVIDRGDIQL